MQWPTNRSRRNCRGRLIFDCKKALKKTLRPSRSTLSKLSAALSGEKMEEDEEEEEVELCGEGTKKTNEHMTGSHTRQKKLGTEFPCETRASRRGDA